jgi:hypothetical protein
VPYNTSHTTNTHKPQNQTQKSDARIHYATLNTPPHPEPHHHHHTHTGCVRRPRPRAATKKTPNNRCLLRTQQCVETRFILPALCSTQPHPPRQTAGVELTRRKPATTCRGLPPHTGKLLRKEVIQPHLPVRLPCYDFVPIAGPTFDHSPPTSGLGHGLRVLPTFVT